MITMTRPPLGGCMSQLADNFERIGDGVFVAQGPGDVNPAFLIVHDAIQLIEMGIRISFPRGYDKVTLHKMFHTLSNGKVRIDSAQALALVALGEQVLQHHPEIEQFERDAITHLIDTVEKAKNTTWTPK